MLIFSSRNLSLDCARVEPGRFVTGQEIDQEIAMERLHAFARQLAVDLVASDALIYLANTDFKLAVQHENGRLFATRVPEASNTALEQTPAQIIGSLERLRSASPQAPQNQVSAAKGAKTRRWRARLNSPWVVGALAMVGAVAVYFSFASDVPDGIEIVNDPIRISTLNAKINGRYGETGSGGSAVLLVAGGRFAVYPAGGNGTAGEPLMDSTYRYGLRGEEVVLVVANGAVLVPGKEGSLRFNESVYPPIRLP